MPPPLQRCTAGCAVRAAAEAAVSEALGLSVAVGGCTRARRYFGPHPRVCGVYAHTSTCERHTVSGTRVTLFLLRALYIWPRALARVAVRLDALYSTYAELTSVRPRLRPCPFLGSVASPRSAHATFAAASPGACRLRPVVLPRQPEGAPRAPARDASQLVLAQARDAPLSAPGCAGRRHRHPHPHPDERQRRRGARRWHQQPHRRGAASVSLATCRSRAEAAAPPPRRTARWAGPCPWGARTCCRPAAGRLAWRESAAPAWPPLAGLPAWRPAAGFQRGGARACRGRASGCAARRASAAARDSNLAWARVRVGARARDRANPNPNPNRQLAHLRLDHLDDRARHLVAQQVLDGGDRALQLIQLRLVRVRVRVRVRVS